MNNFQLKLSTQAYSQREAWNFLKDNGSCLTVSIRQLATLWKWHRSKVERFIKFLKTGAFIETEIVSGRTMIKVNNYNSITPIISVFLNHNETISEDEFEINKRKKSPNSNKLGEDQDVYDGKFDVTRNEEDNQDNELEFKTISRQNKDSLASAITLKEEKKKRSKKRKEEIKENPPPLKGGKKEKKNRKNEMGLFADRSGATGLRDDFENKEAKEILQEIMSQKSQKGPTSIIAEDVIDWAEKNLPASVDVEWELE